MPLRNPSFIVVTTHWWVMFPECRC